MKKREGGKRNANFTINAELWAECREFQKKSGLKIVWSEIIEETLEETLEELKSYEPEFIESLSKKDKDVGDIQMTRKKTLVKLKNLHRKYQGEIQAILDVLDHLDKRERDLMKKE